MAKHIKPPVETDYKIIFLGYLGWFIVALVWTFTLLLIGWVIKTTHKPQIEPVRADEIEIAQFPNRLPVPSPDLKFKEIQMTVTAYNTFEIQTDSSPCIAASGQNICGRTDVVACPRSIPLGTKVEIEGKVYVCEDRLAMKYDNRIDISFDKDLQGAIKFGKQRLTVKIYETME